MILVLVILLLALVLWAPDVDRLGRDEVQYGDPYLDALEAAQRVHAVASAARRAMVDEARRWLEW